MNRIERLRDIFSSERGEGHAESVFLIGLGRFGAAVASRLTELGVEVMAIDTNQELVNAWAERLTDVRTADGTNSDTLRQLGASDFDASVVAIGSALEASILATSALADLESPNIWAKAVTDEHGRILERVGAHHVVYPERQAGERVAQIVTGRVLDYFRLDDGFVLIEVPTPERYIGSTLGDTDIRSRYRATVVCIKKVGQPFTYATQDTVLEQNDLLVVAGTPEDVERFAGKDGA